MSREIRLRAWDKFNEVFWCSDLEEDLAGFFLIVRKSIDGGNPIVVQQYTGLKDKNGEHICEGDLLNVFYTSGDGEHIHDCIYSVEEFGAEGIRLKFERLLWESKGYNQYPLSTELSVRYGHIVIAYDDGKVLELIDSYGRNHLTHQKWKHHDKSRFFERIGNIYESPGLLEPKS